MSIPSGRRVRAARVLLGWTQTDLSNRCVDMTMSISLISAIERGQHRATHEQMKAIGLVLAEAVGGRVQDFFPNFIPRDGDNMHSMEDGQ